MTRERRYRCLNCLEHQLTRPFDVSHLSITCPECGSFERFVNNAVFEQFEAYEAEPPTGLDWEELGRQEKFMVSEQVVRKGRSIEDFSVTD